MGTVCALARETLEREALFQNPPSTKSRYELLHKAVLPHVGSFDAILSGPGGGLLERGLKEVGSKIMYNSPEDGVLGDKMEIWIDSVTVAKPAISSHDRTSLERRLMPSECRERFISYAGRLTARFAYRINDGETRYELRECGQLPVMLCSNRCHLGKLSPKEMIIAREESEEMGGYFIVNGIEKIIRLLIVQRRNHPMAIERSSFAKRGPMYTNYGIQIRCVRRDESSHTNVLHYLKDGQITFRFSWRKSEYLIPVIMILKALGEINDRQIFDGIVGTDTSNSFLTDRLELMLRAYKSYGADTHIEALEFLGEKFRLVMGASPNMSNADAGKLFLHRVVLVHIPGKGAAKQHLLFFMIRKLYSLVAGECCADNADSLQHQEVLLPGVLYANILKEKFDEYLNAFRDNVRLMVRRRQNVDFNDHKFLTRVFTRFSGDIGKKILYFLSTGNLVSPTGLDLQQATGFVVVAERINYHRFLSHFRMIHRGAFFAELKTTTVRKLLPEAWGFLCPVHTPDGAPCGLLNHLSHECRVVTSEEPREEEILDCLRELGVPNDFTSIQGAEFSAVQLNGRIVGYVTHRDAKIIADTLRFLKVKDSGSKIPIDLEIGYVPKSHGGQYPGVFLFTGLSRLTRPVMHLALNKIDWVGPFEQVYMNIAVTRDEIEPKVHDHVELAPTSMMSILANLTPYSDFNQSPRNMYQCQMGKQTMGTPGTALVYRSDNKLYQVQTGQSPIVRAQAYNKYGLDEFPNGSNAVVAVISYTSYDMDDAMILNKSALERGFAHGSIYKSEIIDLSERRRITEPITSRYGFGDDHWPESWRRIIDDDGLPRIGVLLNQGDPLAVYFDEIKGRTFAHVYKSSEPAYVDSVKLLGDDVGRTELQRVSVKLRIARKPNIGDKFSSRHGQKGVCSQKWPQIDMPFSESGISPDIIINPHAFPSRMTIGMFVESLAGKSGAVHGISQDCTPFQFNEEQTAADYFGEQLRVAGFNYHGNEPMYSGVTGEELRVDIYIGVVFYQRLRHMVNDKFQVRSTGPVNRTTMQPVKGRKRGGGIRVGEMERDAFLGHGTAFILQDRLLNCSDYTQAYICRNCGSILSTQMSVPRVGGKAVPRCRQCARELTTHSENLKDAWEDGLGNRFLGGDDIAEIAMPFVLRYLNAEFAAMGVRLRFGVSPS